MSMEIIDLSEKDLDQVAGGFAWVAVEAIAVAVGAAVAVGTVIYNRGKDRAERDNKKDQVQRRGCYAK